jgi:hypothetical protein
MKFTRPGFTLHSKNVATTRSRTSSSTMPKPASGLLSRSMNVSIRGDTSMGPTVNGIKSSAICNRCSQHQEQLRPISSASIRIRTKQSSIWSPRSKKAWSQGSWTKLANQNRVRRHRLGQTASPLRSPEDCALHHYTTHCQLLYDYRSTKTKMDGC